jgi:monoamine oxidase
MTFLNRLSGWTQGAVRAADQGATEAPLMSAKADCVPL